MPLTPDQKLLERIAILEKIVAEQSDILYNHMHKGYDRTKILVGSGGFLTDFSHDDDSSDPTFPIVRALGKDTLVANGDAGEAIITGGTGNGTGGGQHISINGGRGGATGEGGQVTLFGGYGGSTSGGGGAVVIDGGFPDFPNGATGPGGIVQISAGPSNDNSDGAVLDIFGGDGYINSVGTGNGGDIKVWCAQPGSGGKHGNVIIFPNGGNPMSTSAGGGFFVIPKMAGVPTGTPANDGSLVYDSTNNDLYVYNGGWKKVHLA